MERDTLFNIEPTGTGAYGTPLDDDDRPLAPYSNRSTSKDAAKAISKGNVLNELQTRVLNAIGLAGATDEEIEVATGLIHQTASARRRELVLKGVVEASNKTRITSSGRKAIVWVLVNESKGRD